MALLTLESQDQNTDLRHCRPIDLNKVVNDAITQTYYQCDLIGIPYDLTIKDVESLFYHNVIVHYTEQKKLNIHCQIEYIFKKRLVNKDTLPYIQKVFKILCINKVLKPKNFIKKLKDFAKTYKLKYVDEHVLTDCTNKLALLK